MAITREMAGRIEGPAPDEPGAALAVGASARRDPLSAIREIVLLAGTVRSDRFHAGIGRSLLNLPLDQGRALLDRWAEQASGVARWLGRDQISVRIMLDPISPLPTIPAGDGRVAFSAERDLCDYRGTGGVLRDLADAHYDEDDRLIVANGAQHIVGSLAEHVARLAATGGDVALVGHRDGTPSGLMLLSCRVLRLVSRTGFVDFKEQALPLIARRYDVRVEQYREPTGQPVRTLPDYLAALRMHHRRMADRPAVADPFAEDLHPTFRVVEDGASVQPGALLHDSVVLSGATVETGAVVVRSLIGPGARVRRGQRVIDRLIAGSGRARASTGGAA